MLSLLSAALLASAPALADEESAETCLHTKIWDGYTKGFQVRSQVNTTLGTGEHRVYLITLYAGNQYKFLACGDENSANLDLVVYDAQGNVILTDTSNDREPQVTFTPTQTDTFYLAVYGARLNDSGKKAGVSTAVTFK
ncbi:MAG: pre-peptidase C-terminal domain-containing protein [Pseudomonadota bacterium]|nr:pre-peptidase C-terminal domain-containing protein [Pseudomonadota bacterium]